MFVFFFDYSFHVFSLIFDFSKEILHNRKDVFIYLVTVISKSNFKIVSNIINSPTTLKIM